MPWLICSLLGMHRIGTDFAFYPADITAGNPAIFLTGRTFIWQKIHIFKFHKLIFFLRNPKTSVVDPELLPGSGSGIIVPDPAKSERACK